MEKTCQRCGETKPIDAFGVDRGRTSGRFPQCRVCHAQRQRERRLRIGPEEAARREKAYREKRNANAALRERYAARQRDYAVVSLYGMTAVELLSLLDAQEGRCAVCSRTPDPDADRLAMRVLHVDHDHETGKVRGMLCANCNMGLGQFGDDLARLRAAVAYLERATEPAAARVS